MRRIPTSVHGAIKLHSSPTTARRLWPMTVHDIQMMPRILQRIIRRKVLGRAISNLEIALLDRGGLVSEVSAEDDVAVIAVMGANMKGTLGTASRIFSVVAKKGINIRMIAQGSSELNISFVVKEKDGAAVVKAIHEEFNLDKI